MKFKRNQAINQRIARITTHHLVVGIDIAKEAHVAGAVNYRGMEMGQPITFTNNRAGYEKMIRSVEHLQKIKRLQQVIFGLESTGHYGFPLAHWLQERGYEVVQVNPLTTKRNKENRDNKPSKSDAKDAIVIADAVSRGYYSEWRQPDEIYRKLRGAVNEQERLADDLTALGNQLQMLLDQAFPEFTEVFAEWNCPRGLATLQAFPFPEDLKQLTAEQVIAGWRTAGMQRAGGTRGRTWAARLIAAAKRSVGLTDIAPQLKRQLQRLLQRYRATAADKETVGAEICALLQQVPTADRAPLEAVGLSPLFIACLLANTGPLRNFMHGQQVLALAGLNLCERTSGKYKGQIKLSKRGRRQLRKGLYLAMVGLVANHPAFKAWHAHNVDTLKMKKQRSIFKLIGRLVRILVSLAHSGEAFDGNKAQAHAIAA